MTALWIGLGVAVIVTLVAAALLWRRARRALRDPLVRAVLQLPWRSKLTLLRRVMADRRVPLWVKTLIPVLGLYLLSPVDLIPDFVPVLGYLDDVLILGGGLWLLARAVPRTVWESHVADLTARAPSNTAGERG